MKPVSFLSFSPCRGGAAKAAARVYAMVSAHLSETRFISIERATERNETSIKSVLYPGRVDTFCHRLVWILAYCLGRLQRTDSKVKHSLNLFGSRWMRQIVKQADLLHVHWVNNESLAICDFPLLSGKAVITLHDEWLYCGTEHYAYGESSFRRVIEGYTRKNRNSPGVDVSGLIWQLKRYVYPKMHDVIFTVPSEWMRARALQSVLLRGRDVRVVPNPIDTAVFAHDIARPQRGLFPTGSFVIAYGAVGGRASYLKGFDLLERALRLLREESVGADRVKLLVFGGHEIGTCKVAGFDCIQLGHIESPQHLASIYSSADITVVPSRLESFGQVAAESMSCETPVVAFRTSGIIDIVLHDETGFLADPFDVVSLSRGIDFFVNMSVDGIRKRGTDARTRVIGKFGLEIVRSRYIELYGEIGERS